MARELQSKSKRVKEQLSTSTVRKIRSKIAIIYSEHAKVPNLMPSVTTWDNVVVL